MLQVRLDEFEGPLDLLLFFVRRDELDVHDIPVARIADEYLQAVRLAQEIDLDGAADFIYMAALLISIKAKLLLPRPELDDDGEPVDPRQELVDRLLEYVRYKEAAEQLGERHDARSVLFARGHAEPGLEAEADVRYRVSVFELVQALRRVLAEAPEEAYHPVERETVSVEEQRAYLQEALGAGRRSFAELIAGRSRPFVIATFLAVLDTVQRGAVLLFRGADPGTFFLALPSTSAPAT